jgi:hypothetical protein
LAALKPTILLTKNLIYYEKISLIAVMLLFSLKGFSGLPIMVPE